MSSISSSFRTFYCGDFNEDEIEAIMRGIRKMATRLKATSSDEDLAQAVDDWMEKGEWRLDEDFFCGGLYYDGEAVTYEDNEGSL